MIHRRVFHQRHLLAVVKNQSVEPLVHKEVLGLPLVLLQRCGLVASYYRQREHYTGALQFAVAREVEHKVVEEFVCSLRHRRLLDNLFHRVHRSRVLHQSVLHNAVLHGFLIRATRCLHHQE